MTELATQPYRAPEGPVESTVRDLRALAVRALGRMYRPEQGLFAFRLRRRADGELIEGVSRRYTAIALIGLATVDEAVGRRVLGGEEVRGVCRRLLADVRSVDNLGDVALTLWSALALKDEEWWRACDRLRDLRPADGSYPTVELAWALTALTFAPELGESGGALARRIAERLTSSLVPASGMFPHWPVGARRTFLRAHITCFADLVYPIQALARYHARTGDDGAMTAARQGAERMCALQGADGQWWWHYDLRTGRVVERYPVYAVHQDAMAPMALFALYDAGGPNYHTAAERGLSWLLDPPEISGSLIDDSADVIWRKVARREPRKLARTVQALASRVHPALRVPRIDAVLPAGSVDRECRPYHLGWLLYAWSDDRVL